MAAGASLSDDAAALSRILSRELRHPDLAGETMLARTSSHLLRTEGSRLRGLMLLAAAKQGPNKYSPDILEAACAVELFHLATLTHDDMIDSGEMRRGFPTAGAIFGQHAAGFAGTWLVARAVEAIAECGQAAIDLLADTSAQICQGGMDEMTGLGDTWRSTVDYISVASKKTASIISLAARLGGVLSEASDEVVAKLALFGHDLGLAYQIWDDIVDLVGSPEKSGQTALSDLRQGVYSLPVIYAIEENPQLHEVISLVYANQRGDEQTIDAILRTQGLKRAAETADTFYAQAQQTIVDLPDVTGLEMLLEGTRARMIEILG